MFQEKHADDSVVEGSEADGFRDLVWHTVFEKGQSKCIWGELYKVIDSSDVVVQVLDARDPQGTRCHHLEKYLKEHCTHKHLILLLNKCDLVPPWVLSRWLNVLKAEFPTIAFHASVNKSFGKVRVTNLQDATEHMGEVLKRVKKIHLKRAYKIENWEDDNDFLCQLCKLSGKLLKGGEPDLMTAAKMVPHDWQRGKIPFFVPPPKRESPRGEADIDHNKDDSVEDNNQAAA